MKEMEEKNTIDIQYVQIHSQLTKAKIYANAFIKVYAKIMYHKVNTSRKEKVNTSRKEKDNLVLGIIP